MPSVNSPFFVYWTFSYSSTPQSRWGLNFRYKPTHQLQNLKRDTINRSSGKKIKISCHWLSPGFWKSLMGGEWDVVNGQQCLLHIHIFCTVLWGEQQLSAFDFRATFSSFSACTQPQRKITSVLCILFPILELLIHFSSGQLISYKELHLTEQLDKLGCECQDRQHLFFWGLPAKLVLMGMPIYFCLTRVIHWNHFWQPNLNCIEEMAGDIAGGKDFPNVCIKDDCIYPVTVWKYWNFCQILCGFQKKWLYAFFTDSRFQKFKEASEVMRSGWRWLLWFSQLSNSPCLSK